MILPKTYSDPEGSLVDGTSDTSNRVGGVGAGRALLHPLRADLQLGLAEVGDHPLAVNGEEGGDLLGDGVVLDLGLLLLAHGHEVLGHVAHVHHAGSVLEHLQTKSCELFEDRTVADTNIVHCTSPR